AGCCRRLAPVAARGGARCEERRHEAGEQDQAQSDGGHGGAPKHGLCLPPRPARRQAARGRAYNGASLRKGRLGMSEETGDVEIRRGLKGVYFDRSRVCYIDGRAGELRYRGYSIHDLAEHASFEETCHLLLKG